MFKFIITSFNNVVKYESNFDYYNYNEAFSAGYDYLYAWEVINDEHGLVKVIENN